MSANNCTKFADYIKNIIKKNGPITIAHYMTIVSYHKTIGYYENRKIGKDFITSPQFSKIFGGLIAIWFYDLYLKYYYDQEIIIIELGAGNGELMHDVLSVFLQIPNFCQKIIVYIVENSTYLTAIQGYKLKNFINKSMKINWVSDLGLININRPVFFFSNEFFDCLPINQFFCDKEGLREIFINYNEEINRFSLTLGRKLSSSAYFIKKNYLEINHIIEISQTAINISKYINNILRDFGGISLIIDYGKLQQEGKSTLQIVRGSEFINQNSSFLQLLEENCQYLIALKIKFLMFLKVINKLSTSYQQVINKLSTSYQQVINIFESYQQVINKLSTSYQQVINILLIYKQIFIKNGDRSDTINKNFNYSGVGIDQIIKNFNYFDISAHVDFSLIIDNLINCENSFCTQEEFLKKLNFNKLFELFTTGEIDNNMETKLELLCDSTSEKNMGSLFKVLISKNVKPNIK